MGLLKNLVKKVVGGKAPPASAPKAPVSAPEAKPAKLDGNIAKDGDRPWYLDGQDDVDGWDSTDVKKEG